MDPEVKQNTPDIHILDTEGVKHLGKAGIAFIMVLQFGNLLPIIPEAGAVSVIMIGEMLRQAYKGKMGVHKFFYGQQKCGT